MKRTLDEIGMYAMAAKPHMQLFGDNKKRIRHWKQLQMH